MCYVMIYARQGQRITSLDSIWSYTIVNYGFNFGMHLESLVISSPAETMLWGVRKHKTLWTVIHVKIV